MRKTKLLIFVLVALSPLALLAAGSNSDRVQNGNDVKPSQALTRSIALLRMGGELCSGSFLTSKVIVTAAHCLQGVTADGTRAFVQDEEGSWYSVKAHKIVPHPDFELKNTSKGAFVKHDIGLVILKDEFSIAVRPLKIASVDDLRGATSTVTIVGYGLKGPKVGAGSLREGQMTATVTAVAQFYNREGLFMVEQTSNQAGCPGDSGGGVLKGSSSSLYLIGVNSLSTGCQSDGADASMSEIVIHYKKWIQKEAPSVP